MSDDVPYTNREMNEWRSDVASSLERIEKKVDYTNGSVRDITTWKERTTGAMWAFGCCLVLIIIPIAGWALYNQVTEPARIKDAVSSYFDENYSRVQIQP